MLYVVCKNAQKGDWFVQDVVWAPEPMAVLATEQQLLDMERFCCDPYQFSIFSVDLTFNLGEFRVALADALTESFPCAIHLRCFRYLQQNIHHTFMIITFHQL